MFYEEPSSPFAPGEPLKDIDPDSPLEVILEAIHDVGLDVSWVSSQGVVDQPPQSATIRRALMLSDSALLIRIAD